MKSYQVIGAENAFLMAVIEVYNHIHYQITKSIPPFLLNSVPPLCLCVSVVLISAHRRYLQATALSVNYQLSSVLFLHNPYLPINRGSI